MEENEILMDMVLNNEFKGYIMDRKRIRNFLKEIYMLYINNPICKYIVTILFVIMALLLSYRMGTALGKFIWNLKH